MSIEDKYENALGVLCGEKLGFGMDRDVYVCRLDEDYVVKVERDNSSYDQNIIEYRIWTDLQGKPDLQKYFAPCKYLSGNGKILIQKRTEPIRMSDIPDKLPMFLNDMKLENYGILDGKFVCHDYGYIDLTVGWTKRLKKTDFED